MKEDQARENAPEKKGIIDAALRVLGSAAAGIGLTGRSVAEGGTVVDISQPTAGISEKIADPGSSPFGVLDDSKAGEIILARMPHHHDHRPSRRMPEIIDRRRIVIDRSRHVTINPPSYPQQQPYQPQYVPPEQPYYNDAPQQDEYRRQWEQEQAYRQQQEEAYRLQMEEQRRRQEEERRRLEEEERNRFNAPILERNAAIGFHRLPEEVGEGWENKYNARALTIHRDAGLVLAPPRPGENVEGYNAQVRAWNERAAREAEESLRRGNAEIERRARERGRVAEPHGRPEEGMWEHSRGLEKRLRPGVTMEEIRRQMIRNRKLYPFLQDPSPKERISQIPEDEIIKDFEVTEEGWVIERICALQKDGSVLPLDVKETSLNEFLAQELPHVVTINKEGVQLHVCVPDESQPNGYFISTSEMPQGWQPSPENPAVLVPSGKVEAFVKGHFAEKDGDKGYKGKGPKGTVLVQGPALSLGQEENVSKSGIVERA